MPSQPVNLPGRPRLEQLRKRAKDLRRAVRSRQPAALELVARHAPEHRGDPDRFTLATAQLVVARRHGFASWSRLREHLAAHRDLPAGERPRGARTREDLYRTRTGWAAAGDTRRVAAAATAAHPDPAGWLPLFTMRHNGVAVIAFETSAGAVFAELTPRRLTLSPPVAAVPPPGGAAVAFRTALGTVAGVAAPSVDRVDVAHPTDPFTLGRALVAGGVFAAPNAFRTGAAGLLLRAGGCAEEAVPASALPPAAPAVVDRPAPAAAGAHATGLAAALAAADAPPVVDPDQWLPGVEAPLNPAERVRTARYGRLLLWHVTHEQNGPGRPEVTDFAPERGPFGDVTAGADIAATRMFHGFAGGASRSVAVAGLVDDERIAAVALRREGLPDLAARIAGGTFLVTAPDLVDVGRHTPAMTLVASDAAGSVREEVPFRFHDTPGAGRPAGRCAS